METSFLRVTRRASLWAKMLWFDGVKFHTSVYIIIYQSSSSIMAGWLAGLLVVVALNVYEYAILSSVRYAKLSDRLWLSTPYLHLDNLYDRHIFSNKIPATLCLCVGNVFDLSWTGTRLQAMAPYKQDSGKIHSLHRDTWCSTAGFLTLNLT